MGLTVTALLVSHEGERWLPVVLEGLAAQTVAPDRVVTVDTGSTDRSRELVRGALPDADHLDRPGATFPEAVDAALAALTPGPAGEWVWLLHDDSAPAPDALEELLAAASADPEVAVLGAKVRAWPSRKRLLEVGVTMTATGRRETGLERGEHDQGQHDTARDVLAVTTAGMLARRSLLEALPLDPELPATHADLDLGIRAARAGHRVRVAPGAVVFHGEPSRTGPPHRPGDRRRDREAALYTVLAHAAPAALPFLVARLVVGALLRALGLLLVRAPREAGAELAALATTLARPGRLRRARAQRGREATEPRSRLRPLLPPRWLPLRHALDELGHLGSGVARGLAPEGGPRWRRVRTSPFAWTLLLLVVVSVVAVGELLGDGRLLGGALLPAPESAWEWWRAYGATTHDLGTGSTAAAPAYLLPLAVAGTLLLGSASATVDLLVVGVVPLAALGGYRFLRRLTGARPVAVWGAAAYAVLPVTGGALAQGRFGTLVAVVVLPWLAASALSLTGPDQDRRRRAAWRTSLWLALATAFAPQLWWAALVLTAAAVAHLLVRRRGGDLVSWLVPVPAAAVLLLPWWLPVLVDRGAGALFDEAGLAATGVLVDVSALDLLGGRTVTTGAAPVWVAIALPVVAALALVRPASRARTLVAWSVAVLALGWLWLLAVDGRQWLGLPLLVAHGAWITAVATAGAGLPARRSGSWSGRRGAAALVAVTVAGAAALAVPVAGLAWWAVSGPDERPLHRAEPSPVPVYLDDAADRDPTQGTLVLAGDVRSGYDVALRRGEPRALGDEALLSAAEPLTRTVSDLLAAPGASTLDELAGGGVAYVFAAPPVDPALAGAVDALPGLAPSSAGDTGGRAWRLETPARLEVPEPGELSRLRPLLLVLQALAIVTVVALAAPTRGSGP
ncbi:MAG TPA: glycosyltransferase family 2 protein [Marmoricola sp.]|nr:glycosyltransferase family 2 protein [Marmoricola sp.]